MTADPAAMTIARIAALAGVSVPTVSKVINGRSDVAATTRRRVEELIHEHGYRRPGGAPSSSRIIEVAFHEFHGPFAVEVIRGVERVTRAEGLVLSVSEFRSRISQGHPWLQAVFERRPSGVLTVFSRMDSWELDQFTARGIPVVMVDPTGDPGLSVHAVGATNWSGGYQAVRHLLDLGHRRIATVTGPQDMPCSRARFDGYRAALQDAGLPVDMSLVRHGVFHPEDGHEHALPLLRQDNAPTAIVTGNDLQALGVLQAVTAAGYRVPEDLSVVGFDDLAPAAWSNPPLTTVRQPLEDMAAAATDMVLRLVRGQEVTSRRIELATTLIARGSSGPPPTA